MSLLLNAQMCSRRTFTRKTKQMLMHTSAAVQAMYSEQEFLQNSSVPTMKFQSSLPRLGIPKLEDTCKRYMQAQKPLLTAEQFEEAQKLTDEFMGHEGRALHAELVALDKSQKHTSYISAPWFDMYLKYRDSIVLNHNPFIMMSDDPNADQLTRATKFIHSSLRFKNSLDAGLLEPDVFHLNPKKSDTPTYRTAMKWTPSKLAWAASYLGFNAFPLDMSQYSRLFNSSRIPHLVKDELRTDKSGRHMLVIRNGHIFVFDAVNGNGTLKSKDEIHGHLQALMDQSNELNPHAVSVLTAEKRDTWANARTHLEQDPGNAEMLAKIDSALFCISLDDKPVTNELDAMDVYLYSEGHSRWFDKSFTIAISSEGRAAINFEHAWGDGVAVVRYLNDTVVDGLADAYQPSEAAAGADTSSLQHLQFNLDDASKASIASAQATFTDRISKIEMNALKMEEFGRKDLKSKKVGPDSVMQLAFQMAYWRMYGKTAPSYESCATAAFKHGRTETLRPCTTQTLACSEAFDDSHPAGVEEMRGLLEECSKTHGQLTKEAAMGQGFDRHLFSMRYLAEKASNKVDFFDSPAYQGINSIILSTSTVGNPHIQMGGFAPVIPDGLGVGYMVNDSWLGCNCTNYPDSPNGKQFVELVMKSLSDIWAVLEGRNFKKTA